MAVAGALSHPFVSVPVTVYVVVVVGLTVTLAVVIPPGDHRYEAMFKPEAIRVIDPPPQTTEFGGKTVWMEHFAKWK